MRSKHAKRYISILILSYSYICPHTPIFASKELREEASSCYVSSSTCYVLCVLVLLYILSSSYVFCFSQELLARERAAAEKERKLEKASAT